ncbi:hypothetical protein FOL47_000809 [Perkinsus chesapeaki]|uniref:Uncharacterized protein n=1 Tax=Perkinsus chesapeaki TaxID=330153 RepID=A0A7J6KU32_PERCH|nr:hypothetical protein FOL47_000809 [Perkinsus chesapeaki]
MSGYGRRSSGRQTPVPMDISPPPTRRRSARLSPLDHGHSAGGMTLLQIPRLKGLSRCHSQPVIPSVGRLVLKPAKRRRDSVEDRQLEQEGAGGPASGPRPRKLRRSVVLKMRKNPVTIAPSTSGKKRGRKSAGAQETRTPVESPAVRRRLIPSTGTKRSHRPSEIPQPTPDTLSKLRRRLPTASSAGKRSAGEAELPKPSPSASPPSRRRVVPPTASKRSVRSGGGQQRVSSPRKRQKSGPGPSPTGNSRGSTGSGNIPRMTVKMLKEELTKEGIDFSGCVEKSELVEKLRQVRAAGTVRRKARGSPAVSKPQELRPPRRSLRLSQAAALAQQPKAVLKSGLMIELERIEGLGRGADPIELRTMTWIPWTIASAMALIGVLGFLITTSNVGKKGPEPIAVRRSARLRERKEASGDGSEDIPITSGDKRSAVYYIIMATLAIVFVMLASVLVVAIPEVSRPFDSHLQAFSAKLASLSAVSRGGGAAEL